VATRTGLMRDRQRRKSQTCAHMRYMLLIPKAVRPLFTARFTAEAWLFGHTSRPARGRPRDGRGDGGVRAVPLPPLRGAKLGRREYRPGRGILRDVLAFILSLAALFLPHF
jgi:hypothetical protein